MENYISLQQAIEVINSNHSFNYLFTNRMMIEEIIKKNIILYIKINYIQEKLTIFNSKIYCDGFFIKNMDYLRGQLIFDDYGNMKKIPQIKGCSISLTIPKQEYKTDTFLNYIEDNEIIKHTGFIGTYNLIDYNELQEINFKEWVNNGILFSDVSFTIPPYEYPYSNEIILQSNNDYKFSFRLLIDDIFIHTKDLSEIIENKNKIKIKPNKVKNKNEKKENFDKCFDYIYEMYKRDNFLNYSFLYREAKNFLKENYGITHQGFFYSERRFTDLFKKEANNRNRK